MTQPSDFPPADIDAAISRVRMLSKPRAAPSARACAVYARVSDSRQESLPVQLDVLRAYAGRLGVPIRHEYQDEQSGLITTRRQYHELLTLARTGQISHVIVFHSSRWGRDPGEYLTAARELEVLGVEFHATNLGKIEPMMAPVHAMIANMEVRNISAHVLPNMIAKARAGREMGKVRFGYRRTLERGKPEPDPVMYPIAKARGLSLALDSPRHPGSECQPARCRSYSRMTRELATPPPNGYGDDSHPHGLKLTDETAGTIQTWGASS